jgi:hypothetical protein
LASGIPCWSSATSRLSFPWRCYEVSSSHAFLIASDELGGMGGSEALRAIAFRTMPVTSYGLKYVSGQGNFGLLHRSLLCPCPPGQLPTLCPLIGKSALMLFPHRCFLLSTVQRSAPERASLSLLVLSALALAIQNSRIDKLFQTICRN